MFRFLLRRVMSGAVLLVVIATAAYFLLYLGSGNIARGILGPTATDATVAAKEHELGLDRPLVTRFLAWAGNTLTGDFGQSWTTGQPVVDAIMGRAGVTLTLVFGATIVSALVSVMLGVWAALRGGWVDRVVQVVSVLGFAVPGFLVALFLVDVFALRLRLFDPTGYVPITASIGGWAGSVTLPIVALALSGIASIAPQVRGSVIDAMRQDWVRTLRSRGLSLRRVVFKHVLRNAGGPALATLGLQFVGLLGGAVIVENLFAIPGLGQVSVAATSAGDIPMVMGLVVAVGLIVVLVNLIIDVLQGVLNPKVRVE